MHKRFFEEFKKSAVIRVQNGESQLSVASSLGISYKTLNRWVIQAKGQMPSENVSLSEENGRLRKALKEREAEISFLKKSSGVLRKDAVTMYAFLEHCIRCVEVGRHAALPVTRACHLLGVSVSGFYAWRNSDKEHRFGVVHTDAYILETLKAEIKTVTKSYVPGVRNIASGNQLAAIRTSFGFDRFFRIFSHDLKPERKESTSNCCALPIEYYQ